MAKQKHDELSQDDARLDRRLNDYSALARVTAAANSLCGRAGNWPIYAAAAGSALAMATNASASIIYSGIIDASVTAPLAGTNQIQPIDVDGLSHFFNLVVGASVSSAVAKGFASVEAVGPVRVFVNTASTQLAKRFASGNLISAGAGVQEDKRVVAERFSTSVGFGNFVSGVPGLAGIAIIGQGSLHNQTDYGWIRLVYTNNSTTGLPGTLEAIDWAIQTDGEAIGAGYVPEPGTMALGLLACGAAGIAALRRRRKQTIAP